MTSSGPTPWARRYPPLLTLALAVLIAAFVLPSSLNLPQSNPSTVLEYAPVPPEDDTPPAEQGNVSSLGLGSSNSLNTGDSAPPPLPTPGVVGKADKLAQKTCVGPPENRRQTDDPMSPPCVPYFDPNADNFGDTWLGVTKDEIRVLFYFDGNAFYSGEDSPDVGPTPRYMDLDIVQPPCPESYPVGSPSSNACDNAPIRAARALTTFFNLRYQTYNRRVHAYATFTDADTEAERRRDAASHASELKPFAVLDFATFRGYNTAYISSMAGRNVLVFGANSIQPSSFYSESPGLSWGFFPSVETAAKVWGDFVCTKVKPTTVQHSGNASGGGSMNGDQRVYGMYHTSDVSRPELTAYAREAKAALAKCGIIDPITATFKRAGASLDNGDNGSDARDAVIKFRDAGVNTVLWPGGHESKFSSQADALQYYPEIVIAGDLKLDNGTHAGLMTPSVWRNVYGTSYNLRIDDNNTTPGYRAYKEAAPEGPNKDTVYAIEYYRSFFQLFQGIQAAGPRLTPETVDQGLHAIPPFKSSSPYVAAFFYDPGDFTGVKDAMQVWYDPTAQLPDRSTPGCYRMTHDLLPNGVDKDYGARFQTGQWTPGFNAFKPGDPCTRFFDATELRPGG